MTPGEQLETTVWRLMRRYQVTSPWPVQFGRAVLRAADHHTSVVLGTAMENEITAARRAVLDGAAAAGRPVVHYGEDRHACRLRAASAGHAPPLTTDPAAVTCARCKHTRAYQEAAQEVAS